MLFAELSLLLAQVSQIFCSMLLGGQSQIPNKCSNELQQVIIYTTLTTKILSVKYVTLPHSQ